MTELGAPALACPRCKTHLVGVVGGSGRAFGCERCGGAWLDDASFGGVRTSSDPFVSEVVERLAARAPELAPAKDAAIACIICHAPLVRSRIANVELDFCREHGTWFDRNELGAIVDAVRAARDPASSSAAQSREMRHSGPNLVVETGQTIAMDAAHSLWGILGVVADVLFWGDPRYRR